MEIDLQILLILLLQLTLFIFYYLFAPKLKNLIGIKVCPICFAVGSTWFALFLIKYSGILQFDKNLLAILLAETVVGVSFVAEKIDLKIKMDPMIIKALTILYGTLAVSIFAFIHETLGIVLFIPIILLGFLGLRDNKS